MYKFSPYNLVFIALLFIASSCARKNRALFNFEKEELSIVHNKLELPAPRAITISGGDQEETITIRWTCNHDDSNEEFIGYNIYEISPTKIIRHRPLNHAPLKTSAFTIKKKMISSPWIVIKALYSRKNKVIESSCEMAVIINNT